MNPSVPTYRHRALRSHVTALATDAGAPERLETARHVVDHLAANGRFVRSVAMSGDARYHLQERP